MGLLNHLTNKDNSATNAGDGVNDNNADYGQNSTIETGRNTQNPQGPGATGTARREAEGAAAGAVAGHEHHKHQGERGVGVPTGAAVGGIGAREHEHHHNHGTEGTRDREERREFGTTNLQGTQGYDQNQQRAGFNTNTNNNNNTSGLNTDRNRVGGNDLTSHSVEQQVRQKEAELQQVKQQHSSIQEAERLEQEALKRREHANNLGSGGGAADVGSGNAATRGAGNTNY